MYPVQPAPAKLLASNSATRSGPTTMAETENMTMPKHEATKAMA